MKRFVFWLALVGTGAALAYYFDPANGPHRRRTLRRTPLGAALPDERSVDDPARYDAGTPHPTTFHPVEPDAHPVEPGAAEPLVEGVSS